jgi:hypothetical protein
MHRFILVSWVICSLATPALAEQRVTLGWGRLFTNDQIGDGRDRWRSGSYTMSVTSGYGWTGARPDRFGEIIELRLRSEIIAPRALYGPNADDRPYAGVIAYGLHSHMSLYGGDLSAGIDIALTGPQTRIADFQNWFHEQISSPNLSDEVIEGQIPNGSHPGLTLEYAYPLVLSEQVTLRPFVELQAGIEDSLRIGGEIVLGRILRDDLLLRDDPTGQLYRGIRGTETGLALVVGADWARMGDSVFLPSSSGVLAEEERMRARLGIHWQMSPDAAVFYGLTWLSEEFVGQEEGQLLGSVNVNIAF